MFYVIAVPVILAICFTIGFAIGVFSSENDPAEQEREDRDQIEYIRKWHDKHKRS